MFLGNNDKEKAEVILFNMSKGGRSGFRIFIKQIKLSGVDYNYNGTLPQLMSVLK